MNYYKAYKKVLFVCSGLIPSAKLGVVKPLLELQKDKKLTFHMVHERQYYNGLSLKYDVVVMCRAISKNAYEIALDVLNCGKKLIYELDDNFFSIPTETVIGRYHRYPINIFYHIEILKLASVVRVYSSLLHERIIKYNKNVILVNTYFDSDFVNEVNKKSNLNSELRILYATSRNDDSLKLIFEPALLYILNTRENVVLHIWGAVENKISHPRIKYYAFEASYELYLKKIISQNYVLALAPMIDDEFYNSKTNNKYREYGGMGIAGIYSNVSLYNTCINNNVNGLLVSNNVAEWSSAIQLLLDNSDLRRSIEENARLDIKDNYSFSSYKNKWFEIVNQKVEDDSDLFTVVKQQRKDSVLIDLRKDREPLIVLDILKQYVTHTAVDCNDLMMFFMSGVKNVVIVGNINDVKMISSLVFSAGVKILAILDSKVKNNVDLNSVENAKLIFISQRNELGIYGSHIFNDANNNDFVEVLNLAQDLFITCESTCQSGRLSKIKHKYNYMKVIVRWFYDFIKINVFGRNA